MDSLLVLVPVALLLGLSAILVEYQWLTWAVRVLGGLYLAWLGIKLLRARPAAPGSDIAAGGLSGEVRGNSLLFGFLVTLTNPKAIVLFASVFATAVTAATPLWLMVLMVVLVMASSLTWYTIVTLFMSSAPVMRRFQHARHWIERIAGASFVLIGGKIIEYGQADAYGHKKLGGIGALTAEAIHKLTGAATIYQQLGIDSHLMLPDRTGRPLPIAHGGVPIQDVVG